MTPEQFCYWLQGRAELQPDNPPSAEEWQSIREHLATVFVKVTPPLRIEPFITPAPSDTAKEPSWQRWRTECSTGVANVDHTTLATC